MGNVTTGFSMLPCSPVVTRGVRLLVGYFLFALTCWVATETAIGAKNPAHGQEAQTGEGQNGDGTHVQTLFVPGTEDLPLAPWLRVVPGAAFVFDSPAGKVVDVTLAGAVPMVELQRYYESSLPSLGWLQTQVETWVRDDEFLQISMVEEKNVTVVRIQLEQVNE